jgi:hypothetical protein
MKTFILSLLLLVLSFVGYSQTNKFNSTGHHLYNITPSGVIELVTESTSPTKFVFGEDFFSITPPNGEVHVYTIVAREKGANDFKGVMYYTKQGLRLNLYRDADGDYKIIIYEDDGHSYLVYDF